MVRTGIRPSTHPVPQHRSSVTYVQYASSSHLSCWPPQHHRRRTALQVLEPVQRQVSERSCSLFARRIRCSIVALVVGSTILACQSAPEEERPKADREGYGSANTKLPEIVARVNGTPIERTEFERAVRAQERQAGQPVPPQFRETIYERVLDRLVAFHLLMQESAVREVAVTQEEIDVEIDRIRATFQSEAEFKAQMLQWQTSLDVLREEARKDLVVAKVIELAVTPRLSLNEETVRGFYEQHQDQFKQPNAVRASHILIGVPENADDAARTAAREEAARVLADARRGTSFTELARNHSDDEATAATGGDLGLVERGQMVPPFEEALFALETGALSDVVASPFGFHIIYAVENRPEQIFPFDEVSGTIRVMLLDREREVLTASFINELKAAGTIEVYL